MSPITIGLFILLIVSFQNVSGAGNNENDEISNTDFVNIIVSFWELLNSRNPPKLICLGIFLRSNWIFLTTNCAKEVERIGANTIIEYGGYAAEGISPGFINMDCIKQVHSLSKFSIVFLKDKHLLPSSLKLDCVNPYSQGNNPLDGKLVGWGQTSGRPETENVKFHFNRLIQLNENIKPCKIPTFPEGSVLVQDRQIIALVNDIEDKKNMFNQISFADKLIVQDLLETENESNGKGTSQVGNGENDRIRTIELYTVTVSFWRLQKKPHPSELICLGILIRSNWILLTTNCADKLKPFDDVVIEFGVYAIFNDFLKESKIVDIKSVDSKSKFSIVYLNDNHPLLSSLKFDFLKSNPQGDKFFDGTLVGWSKRAKRPETTEAQIIISTRVLLKKNNSKSIRWNIFEGSIIVIGRKIIALASDNRKCAPEFNRISFDDKLRVEAKLEIEDERTSKIEKVQISQEDYENFIVIFFKKSDTQQQDILCLGFLVKPNLVLVTIEGFKKLKPFSETIAVTGRNPLKSNLSGIQKLYESSRFIIVALESHAEITSSLKIFYGEHLREERVNAELIGWNTDGLMKSDEVFDFHHYVRLRDEESVKARLSKVPEGSLVIKGRNIVAVSHMDGANINFYKILFRDYWYVQGHIQEVIPTKIDSENSYSEIVNSEQRSASAYPCKKGRISSEEKKY